jgi:hypothetical protein
MFERHQEKKRTSKDNQCSLIFKAGGMKHKAKTPIEANFWFQFVFNPPALQGHLYAQPVCCLLQQNNSKIIL